MLWDYHVDYSTISSGNGTTLNCNYCCKYILVQDGCFIKTSSVALLTIKTIFIKLDPIKSLGDAWTGGPDDRRLSLLLYKQGSFRKSFLCRSELYRHTYTHKHTLTVHQRRRICSYRALHQYWWPGKSQRHLCNIITIMSPPGRP